VGVVFACLVDLVLFIVHGIMFFGFGIVIMMESQFSCKSEP
jgi:hypothetical protein